MFAMSTRHPVFTALSFASGGAYLMYLKGVRSYAKSLLYALPILIVVAVSNPLFNGLGLSVLFYVWDTPITLEAVCYGLCAGGMLVGVIQWFSCYQAVMTSEKFLGLFGRLSPVLSMMVSMIFRYIPATVRKAGEIRDAQLAMTGMSPRTRKEKISRGVRMASILMSASMEDSIETADSMRARGYGMKKCGRRVHDHFRLRDAVVLVILLAFIVLNGFFIFFHANRFMFYPVFLNFDVPLPAYAVYVLFLTSPLILEAVEGFLRKR